MTFELYEGEFGDYYSGYAEWEAGSSPSMVFSANEQWRVTIDGTAYTASTFYYEYGEAYYLGNTKYDDPMEQLDDGSGIPFTIYGDTWYWQGGFDPSIFTLGTHTIKFERCLIPPAL